MAERLVGHEPGGLAYVYYVSGGSEAVEASIKIARQYFLECGEPERSHFIARRMSYHGNSLGALSVGGHMQRRALYAPMLFPATHIAPCHAYRFRAEGETLEAYGRRAADGLEAEIMRVGPRRVAAFIAEPVVGATLGCVTAAPGYFRRIREICDRHGVLLIADEVMCGMGRTGSFFAMSQEGVCPDIITIAKGLGAGYQPIAAVLVSGPLVDILEKGTGALANGHTYMSHPVACAAALEVQKIITEENLLDRVKARGALLEKRLTERFGNHRHVGDIRGRGLFQAVELVADRATRTPFDPALKPEHQDQGRRVRARARLLSQLPQPSSCSSSPK